VSSNVSAEWALACAQGIAAANALADRPPIAESTAFATFMDAFTVFVTTP
jgi:hypothetical protein